MDEFIASSKLLKIPKTVEPLPDKLEKIAFSDNKCFLISLISGYLGITILSKSFPKRLKLIVFFRASKLYSFFFLG